jgi:CPA2 family monovalent cation:H+ antiporter-2
VLLAIGIETKSISAETHSLILTAAVITMVLTPLISGQTARLYALKKKYFRHEPLFTVNFPVAELAGHVVVAGGGRAGLQVGEVLRRLQIPSVIIDIDQYRVEKAERAGMAVIFGDASRDIVLDAAKIHTARLLVITMPSPAETRAVVNHARKANPGIVIIARVQDASDSKRFRDLDLQATVVPEFEAGIEMARQSLLSLNVPPMEIFEHLEMLRSESTLPVRGSSTIDSKSSCKNT